MVFTLSKPLKLLLNELVYYLSFKNRIEIAYLSLSFFSSVSSFCDWFTNSNCSHVCQLYIRFETFRDKTKLQIDHLQKWLTANEMSKKRWIYVASNIEFLILNNYINAHVFIPDSQKLLQILFSRNPLEFLLFLQF